MGERWLNVCPPTDGRARVDVRARPTRRMQIVRTILEPICTTQEQFSPTRIRRLSANSLSNSFHSW